MKKSEVAHNVSAFAVHADDVGRAKRFYEKVFGWRFEAWGPPGFYLIHTGNDEDPGVLGLLQQRTEPAGKGGPTYFECTISVGDLPAIQAAVEKNGGKVTMQPATIPTVGTMIRFLDTEQNVLSAMHYETPPARAKAR
jgi:uncharacterized protein